MADATRSRKEARFGWKGYVCTAAPTADRPVKQRRVTYAGAQSSVGGQKNACSDITLAAKGKDWAERAGPGRL
jgi:hypothetical protein